MRHWISTSTTLSETTEWVISSFYSTGCSHTQICPESLNTLTFVMEIFTFQIWDKKHSRATTAAACVWRRIFSSASCQTHYCWSKTQQLNDVSILQIIFFMAIEPEYCLSLVIFVLSLFQSQVRRENLLLLPQERRENCL